MNECTVSVHDYVAAFPKTLAPNEVRGMFYLRTFGPLPHPCVRKSKKIKGGGTMEK